MNEALVHLHSTHAAAVSRMNGLDPRDCIPPLTPYYAEEQVAELKAVFKLDV